MFAAGVTGMVWGGIQYVLLNIKGLMVDGER